MEPSYDLSRGETLRAINHIPIFSGIGIHEQHILADKCVIIQRNKDEIIIEQGEAGDCLYAILKGSVLISRQTQSRGWVKVDVLGVGDVFGEIAILRNIPRTSRVTTQTPCTFLSINGKEFLEIYQYFPPQSRDNIQLIIAKRLMQLIE